MSNLLIQEAKQLFKEERQFLLAVNSEKDEVKLLYRLTQANENQVKCIIFIFYFIVQKLIPLKRSVFDIMPNELLKGLKKKFDHPFKAIYDEGREEHMKQIIALHKYVPEFIAPLMKRVPKLNQ